MFSKSQWQFSCKEYFVDVVTKIQGLETITFSALTIWKVHYNWAYIWTEEYVLYNKGPSTDLKELLETKIIQFPN